MTFFFILVLYSSNANSQDSLYAKQIDSLWIASYKPKKIFSKSQDIAGTKFEYTFYKGENVLRSVLEWNKRKKIFILYYYLNDKIVMISPVGLEPYYIFNNKFIFSKYNVLNIEDINRLIVKASEFLMNAYNRVKKKQ